MHGNAAAREAQGRQERREGQRNSAANSKTTGARAGERGAALAQFTRDRAAYFQKVEGEVVRAGAEHCPQDSAPRSPARSPAAGRNRARRTGKDRRQPPESCCASIRRTPRTGGAIWLPTSSRQICREIVEDPAQPLDRCVLETSMGTAAIGLEVQLKEIEQGLMDLLAAAGVQGWRQHR